MAARAKQGGGLIMHREEHLRLASQTRGLGYADLKATEDTLPRTWKFFSEDLPSIAQRASERFQQNKSALWEWTENAITWRHLFQHLNHDNSYNGFDAEMDF